MTKPITYYAQNEAIDALAEAYGSQLEQLTRREKLTILAKLIEIVGQDAQIWMRTGLENLPPQLRTHLLDLLEHSDSQLLGLIVSIATQLQANVYAHEKG